MDGAIVGIKDLVAVRLSPYRTAGLDISINYPLPKEEYDMQAENLKDRIHRA